MTNDTCYADGMSTPPDLTAPVNPNMDPLNVHDRTVQQRTTSTTSGGDARRSGNGAIRVTDLLTRIRIALLAAGTLGVFAILALSLVPGDLRPQVAANGRLEHLLAYFCVMSAFGVLARSIWRPLGAGLLLALVAGLTEIAQAYVPGRHADLADALFSCLGILLGLLASVVATTALRGWFGSRESGSSG